MSVAELPRLPRGSAIAPWLDSDGLYDYTIDGPVVGAPDRQRVAALYAKLVSQGKNKDGSFCRDALKIQVFLGDDSFVECMQARASPERMSHTSVPRAQRLRLPPWPDCLSHCNGDLARALFLAYRSGGATMTALGKLAGLFVSHVSRLIAAAGVGKREA